MTDLNGDRYADIVSISGDGYCVLLSGPNIAPSAGPALTDFRHSGRLDAAVASFNNVYVLRSHSDGRFDTTGTMHAIPVLPNLDKLASNDVAASDFDGDGKPDVAVRVQYGTGVYDLSTPTSAVWFTTATEMAPSRRRHLPEYSTAMHRPLVLAT